MEELRLQLVLGLELRHRHRPRDAGEQAADARGVTLHVCVRVQDLHGDGQRRQATEPIGVPLTPFSSFPRMIFPRRALMASFKKSE